MRATRIPADEQFRLIMECRASGLTDHEWCLQNDIKPGTFYNWVKRLRQKGCTEIPDALNGHSPRRQEIVKIEFSTPGTNGTMISGFGLRPFSFKLQAASMIARACISVISG